MNIKPFIVIACLGVVAGIVSVIVYNEKNPPQAPVAVSYNPYENGVYATGIVESYQPTGSNVNIYAEVSNRVTEIFARNGQVLKKGDPLLAIDDSVQRQIVAKDAAQIELDKANLLNVEEQLDKIQKSYAINKRSVSKNQLDNAINAVKIAKATMEVSKQQYQADQNLLDKFVIKAPIAGVVLRVVPGVGDYASPQGSYDTTTQGMLPSVQMGVDTPFLQVRVYVDEILVPQLPDPQKLKATMFIRGMNNHSIPLEYVSMQPSTIPNIQLSDQRNERVDVRVLPIIFKFSKPTDINVFPGQLVDIYLKGKA
jgi:HlyD family secretion protein